MNLLLVPEQDARTTGPVRIEGRAFRHLKEIRHLQTGDCFPAGIINGPMGEARVLSVAGDHAEVSLDCHKPPPPPLPLTLVMALPRPKMLRRVLQTTIAMGVKRLVLINSYKVEKSYWQTPWLQQEALDEQVRLGLEQSMDTVWPEISLRKRFKPFVEDELAELAADSERLIAHPGVADPCPRGLTSPVTLCVGPEGGFIPYEVELVRQQGFSAVHLGPRILRVEAAIPALLSRLF